MATNVVNLDALIPREDFAIETARTPAKVVDLVSCFLRGDLIPAVILWQASSVFL